MNCEFCDIAIFDAADARRHMLTIAHVRNKRTYELSSAKFIERRRQAALHPKNFYELCMLLNMHKRQDVIALDKNGFFKINTGPQSAIAEELIRILHDSGINYRMNRLPPEIRQPLIEALEEQKRGEEND